MGYECDRKKSVAFFCLDMWYLCHGVSFFWWELPRYSKNQRELSFYTSNLPIKDYIIFQPPSPYGHSPLSHLWWAEGERSPDFCHLYCRYFPTPPSLRDTSPIFCIAKHPVKLRGTAQPYVKSMGDGTYGSVSWTKGESDLCHILMSFFFKFIMINGNIQ